MSGFILLFGLILIVFILGKAVAGSSKNKNNNKNNPDLEKVDKQIEQIIMYAKLVINNLRKDLSLDYALLMYEIIFFFYFLNDVILVNKNAADEFRNKILNRLFESFEYTHNTGFQENKKLINDIYNLRMKNYAAIYTKYNLNFSTDFFMAIFDYQAELLATIKKNKTFSYYNPVPSSPLEVSKKEATDLIYLSALTQNIEIITQFIKNQNNNNY
ncbi:MAG: hypothetical protein K6D95_04635 [Treponema sp.]|nr:hypothetical protein [Treponema sp.]